MTHPVQEPTEHCCDRLCGLRRRLEDEAQVRPVEQHLFSPGMHVPGQEKKLGAVTVSCVCMGCLCMPERHSVCVVDSCGTRTKTSKAMSSIWYAHCEANYDKSSFGCVVTVQYAQDSW